MAYIDKIKIGSETHTLALTPSKGDSTTPVYFDSNGLPQACTALDLNTSGNAATASKITDLTTSDQASSSATQRYVWFSYNDLVTGRPAYSPSFTYQSSTGTLTAPKLHSTGNTTVDGMLTVGGKVELWTDTEGGNIRLTSPNGSLWSIDALENTKLRFIWAEAEVPFSFSKDGTISGAYFTGTANYANSAGTAADMPVTTITKSLTVTTSWQNTGIVSSNLPTGTYAVQISGINNGNCGLWGDIFSGIMSWYDGGTNGGDADEIMLHSAGHARNGGHLFLRIQRTANTDGKTYLQIRAASNASAAQNVVFKFRRLI